MFSYHLQSEDTDILAVSRLRLEIGDHVEDAGVMMDGGNFTDEELGYYLAKNNGDQAATVAELCSVLARHWSGAADVAVGPRRESLSQVAKSWAERATQTRDAITDTSIAMRAFFGRVRAT